MSDLLKHHGSAVIFLHLGGDLAESKCLGVDCLLEMLKQLVQGDYRSQVPQLPLEASEDFLDGLLLVTLETGVGKVNVAVNVSERAVAASCARTPQR